MKRPVYNLVFPSGCRSIKIFDYKFTKVSNYPIQLQKLQQLVAYHSDVQIEINTGEHAVTSFVESANPDQKAILEWGNSKSTALDDILLLLSLFTRRDVFVIDKLEKNMAIVADPRQYSGGGILRCSIPYKANKSRKSSSIVFPCDIGFEEGITEIYRSMRSKEWQDKYKGGYFLFLAQQVFRRQQLETAFTQSWTIWEHLFAMLNQNWLSGKRIQQIDAAEKISYILTAYGLRGEIDNKSRERISSLVEVRNRLVHFGRFPIRGDAYTDAVLFMELTEFILAKILGLLPSGVFNTMEKLEKFLTEQGKVNTWR
jgi:hypothetical protein